MVKSHVHSKREEMKELQNSSQKSNEKQKDGWLGLKILFDFQVFVRFRSPSGRTGQLNETCFDNTAGRKMRQC
jgi:hypothetical protein